MTLNVKPAMVEIATSERKGNTTKMTVAHGEGPNVELWVELPGEHVAKTRGMLQLKLVVKDPKYEGHAYAHLTPLRVREMIREMGAWLESQA